MDFVYSARHARAHLAARSDVTDRVFNVASGTETSLRELAAALLEVMVPTWSPSTGPSGRSTRLPTPRRHRRGARRPRLRGRGRPARGLAPPGGVVALRALGGRPVTAADTGTIPVMRPWLGAEEAEAAAAAVASGWVAQGPRVAEFERRVAERVGAPDGVAVSSCTAGLHLALVALDVGPGDEVVVPSLSFIATANVVRYVGASPVFADVDVATGNLTAETVERVLTPRTRAVVVVHQGGVPADVDAIGALCGPRGVEIVEDAACAIGAELGGRPIGSHSDLVVFSFHPRKVITTGEGGMVMARSPQHAARIRRLREHGMSVSAADRHASQRVVLEQYLEVGFNYRMTEIQAAVGLVQLGRLDAVVERRRSLAARYTSAWPASRASPRPTTPPRGRTSSRCGSLLRRDFRCRRDELLQYLLDRASRPAGESWRRTSNPRYAGAPHDGLPVTERITATAHPAPLPRDDRHRPRPRGRGPPRGRGGHRAVTPAPLLLVGSGGFRNARRRRR